MITAGSSRGKWSLPSNGAPAGVAGRYRLGGVAAPGAECETACQLASAIAWVISPASRSDIRGPATRRLDGSARRWPGRKRPGHPEVHDLVRIDSEQEPDSLRGLRGRDKDKLRAVRPRTHQRLPVLHHEHSGAGICPRRLQPVGIIAMDGRPVHRAARQRQAAQLIGGQPGTGNIRREARSRAHRDAVSSAPIAGTVSHCRAHENRLRILARPGRRQAAGAGRRCADAPDGRPGPSDDQSARTASFPVAA